jgi:hypothetical protein
MRGGGLSARKAPVGGNRHVAPLPDRHPSPGSSTPERMSGRTRAHGNGANAVPESLTRPPEPKQPQTVVGSRGTAVHESKRQVVRAGVVLKNGSALPRQLSDGVSGSVIMPSPWEVRAAAAWYVVCCCLIGCSPRHTAPQDALRGGHGVTARVSPSYNGPLCFPRCTRCTPSKGTRPRASGASCESSSPGAGRCGGLFHPATAEPWAARPA